MLKLTRRDNNDIYINPTYIVTIIPYGITETDSARIRTINGAEYYVQETAEEIIKKMEEALVTGASYNLKGE